MRHSGTHYFFQGSQHIFFYPALCRASPVLLSPQNIPLNPTKFNFLCSLLKAQQARYGLWGYSDAAEKANPAPGFGPHPLGELLCSLFAWNEIGWWVPMKSQGGCVDICPAGNTTLINTSIFGCPKKVVLNADPQFNCISITLERVRNASSSASSQAY